MEPTSPKRQAAITAIVVIVLIAIAVGAVAFSQKPKSETASNTTASPSGSPSTTSSPAVAGDKASSGSSYKDGSYTATGAYRSPGGNEQVTITLVLKDGVITDTNAVSGSSNPTGTQYQGQFIAGYKSQVLGKNIDELNVSKVSGSSLTSQGFNDAVTQIKAQAQA